MTNFEIQEKLKTLISQERRLTNDILELINIADDRKIHLERGYSSLFEWLTKSFGYSESAAQRRIQAARLLKTVPAIKEKVESGSVNLSTLAKTQSFIQQQEKIIGHKLSMPEKARVVQQIENKSSAEAEKTLFGLFPEVSKGLCQEKVTRMGDDRTRLALTVDDSTLKNLNKVRDLLSHTLPNADWAEIVGYLAADFIKKTSKKEEVRKLSEGRRKVKDERRLLGPKRNTAATKHRVKISMPTRRLVLQRANRRCEYVDQQTKKRCESTFRIEIDHILPWALGGGNSPENLRCLCRDHNQLASVQILGKSLACHWRQRDRA